MTNDKVSTMTIYRDLAFDNHFEQFLAIVTRPNRPSFDTEACWFIAYAVYENWRLETLEKPQKKIPGHSHEVKLWGP